MEVHESVFEVVVVDFRHEVWVVLDEVLKVVRDGLFVPVRDQDLNVLPALFVHFVVLINLGILDLSLEDGFDVGLLFNPEDLLCLTLGSAHLKPESIPEVALKVVRGVTLEVHSIFDDANSGSDMFRLLDMLSRDQHSSVLALDNLADQ